MCASMNTAADCGSDKDTERKRDRLSNMTNYSVSVSLHYNE